MTTIIREAINCDYEYIRYNKQLRLIHSIDDDMYQVQSIIEACRENKRANDWFNTQNSKAIIKRFYQKKKYAGSLASDNRIHVPVGLRGYYVHRVLVNAVAMWASPDYALDILEMLDEIAASERAEIANRKRKLKTETVFLIRNSLKVVKTGIRLYSR